MLKINPRALKINPRVLKVNPRALKIDPQTPKINPNITPAQSLNYSSPDLTGLYLMY